VCTDELADTGLELDSVVRTEELADTGLELDSVVRTEELADTPFRTRVGQCVSDLLE